jgi:hypothetical protein
MGFALAMQGDWILATVSISDTSLWKILTFDQSIVERGKASGYIPKLLQKRNGEGLRGLHLGERTHVGTRCLTKFGNGTGQDFVVVMI